MRQNEMTEGSRVNRMLSNKYGVQGPPAPFMASELFPMIDVGSPPPEDYYLADQRLAMGRRIDAATGAQYSAVGIHNPAGSGAIVVVDSIHLYSTSTLLADVRIDTNPTTDATGSGWWRDTRWSGAGAPVADLFDRTTATQTGNLVGVIRVLANTDGVVEGPFVLGEDGWVGVDWQTVSQAMDATFRWREYAATEAELRR